MIGRRKEGRAGEPERGLVRRFGALAGLGVVLVGAAAFGLLYTAFATVTSMLLFGWLLLIGGVVGLAHAVLGRAGNYFWLGAAVAVLNLAAGVVLVVRPHAAPEGLTLFAALLFLSAGSYRLLGGLVVRGPQFGPTLALGVLDLVIGILVLGPWPSSSRYTLGLYFSLALLFDGLALVGIGVGGRRVVGMVGEARRAAAEEEQGKEEQGEERQRKEGQGEERQRKEGQGEEEAPPAEGTSQPPDPGNPAGP